MQRRTRIGIAACMAAAAFYWVGCAAVNEALNSEALNKQLLDYATVDAGATVKSKGSNGARLADSLINGVKSSSQWSVGDGWEYTWTLTAEQYRQCCNIGSQGQSQKRGIEGAVANGAPWVLITFDEPKRINQIVIHEANAPDAPAVGIENAFLQVRDMNDDLNPWKTVGMVQSGWGYVPGRQAFQMKPVSKFLFNTVKTDQVRVIINTMMKKKRAESGQTLRGRAAKAFVMTVRLMEIEVKGSEADMSISASGIKASSGSKKKNAIKEPISSNVFDGTL
ncbi:MAG: hypothetical protein OXT69_10000 [Candidatus Poribacteria bacterium]|nr:hypothetical protein [Candidatus Poribacteria bacterium]